MKNIIEDYFAFKDYFFNPPYEIEPDLSKFVCNAMANIVRRSVKDSLAGPLELSFSNYVSQPGKYYMKRQFICVPTLDQLNNSFGKL